jgi:hypothetical protein
MEFKFIGGEGTTFKLKLSAKSFSKAYAKDWDKHELANGNPFRYKAMVIRCQLDSVGR